MSICSIGLTLPLGAVITEPLLKETRAFPQTILLLVLAYLMRLSIHRFSPFSQCSCTHPEWHRHPFYHSFLLLASRASDNGGALWLSVATQASIACFGHLFDLTEDLPTGGAAKAAFVFDAASVAQRLPAPEHSAALSLAPLIRVMLRSTTLLTM